MIKGSRYLRLLAQRPPRHSRSVRPSGGSIRPYSTSHPEASSSSSVSRDSYGSSSSLPKTYGPSSAPPRLRFAPSPTGHLHLGGLRTALLNHIVAKQGKGKWVLRVEDTDRERLVPGSIDQMRRILDWVDIGYDEGPGAGGSHGPYVQSERLDLYRQYVKQLLETDHAYECFCSVEDLAAARVAWKGEGAYFNYDGRCRHLTDEERARRKKAGHKYVVRWKDPGHLPELPEDLIFGHVNPHSDVEGGPFAFGKDDYVLFKADGYPTYHLANVVDDHAMEISHVVRGEDWLPSLPKHIALYKALGWTPPTFAHVPLLCRADGSKLSKRHADTTADWYKDEGFEPEAVVNYLAILGWDYTKTLDATTAAQPIPPQVVRRDNHSYHEVFTLSQLVESFDLTHVTRRKASISNEKLEFLNRMHLRKKAGLLGSDGELIEAGKSRTEGIGAGKMKMIEAFQRDLKAIPELKDNPQVNSWDYVGEVFEYEMPRVKRFRELSQNVGFWFKAPSYSTPEAEALLKSIKRDDYIKFLTFVIPRLDKIAQEVNHFTRDDGWIMANRAHNSLGLKHRGAVLKAMRHALTGQMQGPSVPDIMSVLGPTTVVERLLDGLRYVQERK